MSDTRIVQGIIVGANMIGAGIVELGVIFVIVNSNADEYGIGDGVIAKIATSLSVTTLTCFSRMTTLLELIIAHPKGI